MKERSFFRTDPKKLEENRITHIVSILSKMQYKKSDKSEKVKMTRNHNSIMNRGKNCEALKIAQNGCHREIAQLYFSFQMGHFEVCYDHVILHRWRNIPMAYFRIAHILNSPFWYSSRIPTKSGSKLMTRWQNLQVFDPVLLNHK